MAEDLLSCQREQATMAEEDVFSSGALSTFIKQCRNTLAHKNTLIIKYSTSFTSNATGFYMLSSLENEKPQKFTMSESVRGNTLCKKKESKCSCVLLAVTLSVVSVLAAAFFVVACKTKVCVLNFLCKTIFNIVINNAL